MKTKVEHRKVRLQDHEVWMIAITPEKECWMCKYLSELIDEDENLEE